MSVSPTAAPGALRAALSDFRLTPDSPPTELTELTIDGGAIPVFVNEFWTARQRRSLALHEISYRACFKPELPRFFIERLTTPGDVVCDPFAGRGTTPLEAALLGRRPLANDLNPLSALLTRPRLTPPDPEALAARLEAIPRTADTAGEPDLSMFYHPDTEAEIRALRAWLHERQMTGESDALDAWIRMVATNRLTGHSPGFFSVYTLPPNQAVTPDRQVLINTRRDQTPPYRDTHALILRKSRGLLRGLDAAMRERLDAAAPTAAFFTADARNLADIPDATVQLTVTSPPFLNVVQYARDNWLRCWFNHIDQQAVAARLTVPSRLEDWETVMRAVFVELARITRPGGWVAFEVGEIRNGTLRLEEVVAPLGRAAGLRSEAVLINRQAFTKTANIWGIRNNRGGTNSNRIVLFQKR